MDNREFLTQCFLNKFGQVPNSVTDEIQRSKMFAEILDYILPEVFEKKKNNSNLLKEEFSDFQREIIPELKQVINNKSNSNGNVYEMFGAFSLSSANAVTRKLNTKLGLLWERIASLSSNIISPELHLGIKLAGVDVIVNYENKLYYTQLKTQKNTLTGSDSSRVNRELRVFNNAWFVACIDNSANWTYSGKINRLIGEEFWSKTDINYSDILENLRETINLAEKLFNK